MLLRKNAWDLLKEDPEQAIAINIKRVLFVRMYLEPVKLSPDVSGKSLYFEPGCHTLAHAFANVFGLKAVDGEHVFFKARSVIPKIKFWRISKLFELEYSSYLHSWVELKLPSERRVIFDLYPAENNSILPIVVAAPNPAYVGPQDEQASSNLKYIETEDFRNKVSITEEVIRTVANKHGLW